MIAVISGSTGLVGAQLIHKLLDDSRFTQVISVSRRSLKLTSSKLTEVICENFNDLSSHRSELKGDIYFCCLGTTIKTAGSRERFKAVDHDAVVEFGRIAKLHDARSFVVISADSANANSRIFYSRVKGEMEKDLEKMGLKHLVILRPGLLMGERKEFRPGEKVAMIVLGNIGPLLPNGIRKSVMTDIHVLAERMKEEALLTAPTVSNIKARDI